MPMLTDDEWAALKAALDHARSGRGRPFRDERKTVEGVLWRLKNGPPWRAVPHEFGPWWRSAQLHKRWSRSGVWEEAFEHLRDTGRPDLATVMLDGTVVRAHPKAAGAKKGARAGMARSQT